MPTISPPATGSSAAYPSAPSWWEAARRSGALITARLASEAAFHRVNEVDPLICPKCQGEMRIIAFIEDEQAFKKILKRIGLEFDLPSDCRRIGLLESMGGE